MERDLLFKRATITNANNDWENFRRKRNEVVKLIRQHKTNYFKEKIDDCSGDAVRMWKTLKELTNGKNITYKKEIKCGVNIIRDEKGICEAFNDYFIDSIEEISRDIIKDNNYNFAIENIKENELIWTEFKTIDIGTLRKYVYMMPNKNSDMDGITTKILKIAFEAIGNRINDVINCSLETGTVPQNWKKSIVIPVEKKANTILCNEHRPLNMLPPYEKLLELIVKDQLLEFINDSNILTKHQAGFRKLNSCESAIQSVLVNWKEALSNKQYVGAIFLDFKRAFETIDRALLLVKLEKMGIKGTVWEWFCSYLMGRYQVVKYGNTISNNRDVEYGVPQGSVLGPVLFILYINDIVNVVTNCDIQMFADDTLLYVVGNDVDVICETLNTELKNIFKWLGENNLMLNVEKTKVMLLGTKHNLNNELYCNIKINNQEIENVTEFKYLGVVIDNNLSFCKHAEYITKKISKKVNYLSRISKYLSTWTKRIIYNTIIHPHFTYCPTIIFMLNNTQINDLQIKQNKALRNILNCNIYTRVKFMLDCANILSVRQSVMLNVFLFIYKLLNNMLPKHLFDSCTFVSDIHNYATRGQHNFYIQRTSTNFGENQLFIKGLKLYNDLPIDVKNSQNLNVFKKKCISYVKQKWPV